MAQGGRTVGPSPVEIQQEQARRTQEAFTNMLASIQGAWQREQEMKEVARQADQTARQNDAIRAGETLKYVLEKGTATQSFREVATTMEPFLQDSLKRMGVSPEIIRPTIESMKSGALRPEQWDIAAAMWSSKAPDSVEQAGQAFGKYMGGVLQGGGMAPNEPGAQVQPPPTEFPPRGGMGAGATQGPPSVVPQQTQPTVPQGAAPTAPPVTTAPQPSTPAAPPPAAAPVTPEEQKSNSALYQAVQGMDMLTKLLTEGGGASPQTVNVSRQVALNYEAYSKYLGANPTEAQQAFAARDTEAYQSYMATYYSSPERIEMLKAKLAEEAQNSPAAKMEIIAGALKTLGDVAETQRKIDQFGPEQERLGRQAELQDLQSQRDLQIAELRLQMSDKELQAILARASEAERDAAGDLSESETMRRNAAFALAEGFVGQMNDLLIDKTTRQAVDYTRWNETSVATYNNARQSAINAYMNAGLTKEEAESWVSPPATRSVIPARNRIFPRSGRTETITTMGAPASAAAGRAPTPTPIPQGTIQLAPTAQPAARTTTPTLMDQMNQDYLGTR